MTRPDASSALGEDLVDELRLIVEAAPFAIVVSYQSGRVVLVNAEAERLFGSARERLLEHKVESLMPQKYRGSHVRFRGVYMTHPEPRHMGMSRDLVALRSDGTEFPVEIGLTPIATSRGEYVMAVMVDITERKRAEELRLANASVQQYNQDLQKLNKELESFSYSVSHDLQAPVRAVKEYASILERDYGDRLDADGLHLIATVKSEAARMASLIEDLLKFSALGRKPIETQRIAMTALVREIAAGQLLSAPPGTDLRVDELPSVEGDRSLVGQVWTNLISNALKYTASRRPAVIRISGSIDDGHATYRIEDNGVGFNMKYYDKLFGVFQRLHHADEFPGSGVGLAIVHSIVARHGGRAWAHGVPGEGAVFFFTLPVRNAS